MQMEAVRKESYTILYIHHPSEEVIKISKMNFIEKMKYFCKEQ